MIQICFVEWSDLGTPEALWIFEAEEFSPLTVAGDSHSNNLFEDTEKKTEENRKLIYEKLSVQQ